MSALPGCFENIIGLSRIDCPCVEDRPVDAGVSESGLYMDEADGMNLRLIDAGAKCGETSLWTRMARARANAIEQTKTDVMTCLAKETDQRRQSGLSQIGDEKKAKGSGILLRRPWHGMTLQVHKIKGGIAQVMSIGAGFKSTGTVTVHVYERDTVDPIASYTISTQANVVVWTDLAIPLDLDLKPIGYTPARYWFIFQPEPGMMAMDSRINCGGCGGFSPSWNEGNPQYNSPNGKAGYGWAEWSMAAGTSGTNLDDRENWSRENPSQGILLRVNFDCDQQSTFCPDSPNYTTDPIQRALAQAVLYRANANLLMDILSSTDINIYTMTAGEILERMRQDFLYQYNGITKGVMGPDGKWLNGFLCMELSDQKNVNRYGDCLKCKDRWGMSVSGIRG